MCVKLFLILSHGDNICILNFCCIYANKKLVKAETKIVLLDPVLPISFIDHPIVFGNKS